MGYLHNPLYRNLRIIRFRPADLIAIHCLLPAVHTVSFHVYFSIAVASEHVSTSPFVTH